MNALLAALHNARARSRTLDRTAARAGRRGAPNRYAVCLFVAAVASAVSTTASGATFDWSTVVNNGDPVPGSTRKFNSYSPPSVNARGMVVFRGRSRGGQDQGEPERGVYARNMSNAASVVVKIADVQTIVPQPNNTIYNGQLASFNEFPAFPRIGVNSNTVATRGQSQPVWTYMLNGTETRVGTSGIYATPNGALVTGMAQLGAVPTFAHFQVPGAPPGTKFDQFPGAPTLATASVTAFKGNYTDGVNGVRQIQWVSA